jgi:hypothetical protein
VQVGPATLAACAAAVLTVAVARPAHGLAQAQAAWLPPSVEAGVTRQLADRLATLPMGGRTPPTEAQRLTRAQDAVSKLRAVFEGWGVSGTTAKAPALDGVGVPASKDRLLDAMGRYQVCNFVLALQLDPNGHPDDFNLQFTGVLGLTAGTMAVLYLRQPFVAAGGSQQAIEAHLTNEAMQALGARVQRDPKLLERAQAGCSPVVVELVTKVVG